MANFHRVCKFRSRTKGRPHCRNVWCSGSNLKSDRIATFECLVEQTFGYNVALLTSVDVVPLMKTSGVAEDSGHCTYSIVVMCFLNCLSLFHLVFYLLQLY